MVSKRQYYNVANDLNQVIKKPAYSVFVLLILVSCNYTSSLLFVCLIVFCLGQGNVVILNPRVSRN